MATIIVALLAASRLRRISILFRTPGDAAAICWPAPRLPRNFRKSSTSIRARRPARSAYLLLADAQKAEKKFNEANATLQTFVDKNPKHEMAGTARLAMAGNLEALGKKDEALATYQRLATSDPRPLPRPSPYFRKFIC